jgi:hypothetical protein
MWTLKGEFMAVLACGCREYLMCECHHDGVSDGWRQSFNPHRNSWPRITRDRRWTFGFNLVVGALTFTGNLRLSPRTPTSL